MVGDLSPEYSSSEWRVSCSQCPKRAGPFNYREMRAFAPLWFDLRERGGELWAWNREHLAMLLDLFEGRESSRHEYAWIATYVPGNWKRRREHFAKPARRLLEG